MKILVTGGSGFIGSAAAARLAQRGHEVVLAGRGEGAGLKVDFSAFPTRHWWAQQLEGFDAVVNAVGILRETRAQTFEALHTRAPIELFEGCAIAGVPRVVQVSALGAGPDARSGYHRSKAIADEVLRAIPVHGAIVQPSLVYGMGGSSAGLFNALAAAPVLMMPRRGGMLVQPVHIDDVVDGIVALVESPAAVGTFAFAGDVPISMRDYLAALRARLGFASPLRMWSMPEALFRAAAKAMGKVPGSLLDDETADMLLAGNTTEKNALPHLLRRPLKTYGEFLSRSELPGARSQAVLAWARPVLRASIAFVWLWTAVVSLGLYPVAQSYELLARVGLHGTLATVALYGAAALDLLFGVMTLASPLLARGLRTSWLWAAQLALIAGYTVLITIFLPEYWLHPYGPLSKNLPMMAVIGLLWALEPPRRRT